MLHRAIVVACVLCFVAVGAGTASATTYTFTQLPPCPSDTRAYAFAENIVNGTTIEAGGKTGYAAATTKPKDATVWLNAGAGGIDTATSYTTNGYLATTGGEVRGIASNGDLAGYAYYSNGNYSPFYLGSGGTTATILPSLTTQAAAYGINNSKQVVGEDDAVGSAVDGGAVSSQAVIWTRSSGNWGETTLPNLSGGTYSGAYAITNGGTIGGWSNVLINGSQYTDATTWTYNGSNWGVNDLVNRSLAQNTVGQAVLTAVANSTGEAVGESSLAAAPQFSYYAAIFSGGTATPLTLPYTGTSGRTDSAYGVNDSGVVVGTSLTGTSSSSQNDAFIYNLGGNGLVQDMNTVFASIIPAGWSLTVATAIDDNGDIAGYASTPSGYEGFVISAPLPTPEPSTLLLFVTGLVGLLAYAWRKRK